MSDKFKLTLSAWQLMALEELVEGSTRLDQFDKTSFDALKTKVHRAWNQHPKGGKNAERTI